MSVDFERLVRYLHDCYRADNREQALLDIFAAKVEYRSVVEAAAGFLEGDRGQPAFLPADAGLQATAKEALLHRSEKELLLGALFIAGRLPEDAGQRKICAPLLLAPVAWNEGAGRLAVELEQWRFNQPLLAMLAGLGGQDADAFEQWLASWPPPPLAPRVVAARVRALTRDLPGVTSLLDPEAFVAAGETLLRRGRNSRAAGAGVVQLTVLWSQAVLLLRRSVDTRGVLSELERLAGESPSRPLRCLLDSGALAETGDPGEAEQEADRESSEVVLAPAILSPAQRQVVRNAVEAPLSLVIGPPGTGKSFTIAAIALDALSRGRSVLVASKMNHAVDVVGDKFEAMLGLSDAMVRGGRKEYRKELRDRLERWLSGALPSPEDPLRSGIDEALHDYLSEPRTLSLPRPAPGKPTESGLRQRLSELDDSLADLEHRLELRSLKEQRFGPLFLADPENPWWMRWRDRWRLGRLGSWLAAQPPYWQIMETYRQQQEERLDVLRRLLQVRFFRRLAKVLLNNRLQLTRLRDAVRARTVNRRESLWRRIDADILLQALPVWLVNLSDAASILPFEKEMFDLVILDEATQCDVASCLPVLQRAKRAVVVGDPRQLRHLSFLPRPRQKQLAERHQLPAAIEESFDYRDRSVLDVVDGALGSQHRVVFLDEHFRSAPSIIEFSNREFYDRRLRVMQESPAHDWHRALYLEVVAGRREESGANPLEAEAAVAAVVRWTAEEASLPGRLRHTLGVLSPFRAQVDLITRLLAEALPADLATAHDLRVGTAHAFQGEERDVMVLSLALDAASHPSAFRFLERADVFNVSITRARGIQHVLTSLDPESAPGSGLLGRFLRHMRQDRSSPVPGLIEDAFAVELAARLRLEGCRVWSPYPVAGFRVDVVLERRGRCLGIDLVGYPGELAGSFGLERYRLFNRAGLPLMPLPYSAWCADQDRCIEAVLSRLQTT